MDEIIDFYKSFDRFKPYSKYKIYRHIKQSYDNEQYKIYRDNEKIWGYVNWAFVDEEAEKRFLETGKLYKWNCGNRVLVVDLLATKNVREIVSDLKNLAEQRLEKKTQYQWIRLDDDMKTVYRRMNGTTKGIGI